MLKLVSSVGNIAYKAAAKSGLAAGTEQPPYPCALPLPVVEDPNDVDKLDAIADSIYDAVRDLITNPEHQWAPMNFRDPDPEGDLVLSFKPHIGPYNFAHGSMSFRNTTPRLIIDNIHGKSIQYRRQYSHDLAAFEILAEPRPGLQIQYHEQAAPPPVATRHLCYLTNTRYVASEDSWYVFGSSIEYLRHKPRSKTIQAICLWGWELTQVGGNTLATYVSAMNPNGWTPPFIVNFVKGEIAKELCAIRRVAYETRDGIIPTAAQMLANELAATVKGTDISKPHKDTAALTNQSASVVIRMATNTLTAGSELLRNTSTISDESDVLLEEDELAWRELQETEELIFF